MPLMVCRDCGHAHTLGQCPRCAGRAAKEAGLPDIPPSYLPAIDKAAWHQGWRDGESRAPRRRGGLREV